jgi:hypothetical protein
MVKGDAPIVSAKVARELILSGRAPSGLVVRDPHAPELGNNLFLEGCPGLEALPAGLVVWGDLQISDCPDLQSLPPELELRNKLVLRNCPAITSLPDDLIAGHFFREGRWMGGVWLEDCPGVTGIPEGLRLEYLSLKRCDGLISLPRRLNVPGYLTVEHCHSLAALSQELEAGGRVNLIDLPVLRVLPRRWRGGQVLYIEDCPGVTELTNLEAGQVHLKGATGLQAFPTGIACKNLGIEDADWLTEIPDDLGWELDCLGLLRCPNLVRFPSGLRAPYHFNLEGCTGLKSLPPGLRVVGELILSGCSSLTELPPDLKDDEPDIPNEDGSFPAPPCEATYADFSGCTALTELPDHVFTHDRFTYWVSLSGCTALRSLPDGLHVVEDLDFSGCAALTRLPARLWVGGRLNLSGCSGLADWPHDLHVGGEIEVAGAGLPGLPESLRHVRLTRDEVEVDERGTDAST